MSLDLHAVVFVGVATEHAADIRVAIAGGVEDTRTQQGCITYQACEDPRSPGSFAIIEHWSDQAAFDQHMKTAGVQRMAEMLQAIDANIEVRIFNGL